MSGRKLLIGAGYLLAAIVLWSVLRKEPEPAPNSYEVAPAAELASRSRLEKALDKPVALHLKQIPLDRAVKQISDRVGVPIRLDVRRLEDSSIRADEPVTIDVSGISLRSALNLLLNGYDLAWHLNDETLVVTARESGCPSDPTVFVCAVQDLVQDRSTGGVVLDYQQLIDTITDVVVPWTWDVAGGPASIHADPAAGALVISQSREYHAQIEALLTALRKARDAQGIRPGETLTNSVKRPYSSQTMAGAGGPAAAQAKTPTGAANQSAETPADGARTPNSTAPENQ